MTAGTVVERNELTPHQQVWDLAQAVVASRALHLVADLGVADYLDDSATEQELAARCGADAAALGRVLRLLTTYDVFRYDGTRFTHTEASRVLRTDHPTSMRAFAQLNSLPVAWQSLAALDVAVRSGTAGARAVHPAGFFAYLAEHPGEEAVFESAMTAKAHADIADVLQAYDFRRFSSIADIAGGRGHLLEAVLQAAPDASGVLFELPAVAAQFQPSARARAQSGDFFSDDLPVADAYLLMEILHDWTDEEALTILRGVRRAAPAGAVVLVIEHIASDEGVERFSATLDVLMLAVTGGRERSGTELSALLEAAGFGAPRVVRTDGPIAIVEATAR